MELDQLQKLQNRAARVITNRSFDAPSRPLIQELGWMTTEELVNGETKTMVFKSLHDLAPEYLRSLFTRNSQCCIHALRNIMTDLKLPRKNSANGEQNYGTASQLSLSRHHL